ncbi:hypothetical protein [Paenibacillus zanthoxyli]|uniref:hypothetical protein n=1 Tax=Paenibacillus zanthoxyli TaxID=369399 RepID=UPI000471B19D|nr:hypothetical protein [Paenibacillus zanthoxyli]
MKKAAVIALSTCLFLTASAATAFASTEPVGTKKMEHKMHVKEHKIHAKEHKLHAKEHHKMKAHKLHAKEKGKAHKLHAKSIKPKALPKSGYGGVSE